MLSKIIDIFLPTVTRIFNASLITSVFPRLWKLSIIRPIPKVNTLTNNNDFFRPISILPTLSKALEHIVHKELMDYLHTHDLLDPYQSGFRTDHSTTRPTALLKVTEDIREGMDRRELAVLTLLDFSKAFDTVDHDLLIQKLKLLYLSESAITWFGSYIREREREQKVSLNNRSSSWR